MECDFLTNDYDLSVRYFFSVVFELYFR